ncbi:hypothetical protein BC938DRAFT_476997 [Jimgerdemannia flammicorona]|uniref:F-box domain-containing protein n=1 Tax=Jimgerdemannia flammicorona TaxID=994334 RepID=A0A433PCQ0_9FUNG|nr:hypothetical protein BC938DRAFT_476997 [Jimgerdemannia flammicorona]
MPLTTLPDKLQHTIFTGLITNSRDSYDSGILDLYCCSLVSREWYTATLKFLPRHVLHTENLSKSELERLANVLAFSQRYELKLGRVPRWVQIMATNLLCIHPWQPVTILDQRRVGPISRVVRGLQPHVHTLSLYLFEATDPHRLMLLHELATQLAPGLRAIRSLRISKLAEIKCATLPISKLAKVKHIVPRISKLAKVKHTTPIPQTAPHPVLTLATHLNLYLDQIHLLESQISPALLLALRRCPGIRVLRLHSVTVTASLSPDFLSDTIACWVDLRVLSIRDMAAEAKNKKKPVPFLAPTIHYLSHCPPPELSILELDDNAPHDPSTDLPRLVTACGRRLTSLALPPLETRADPRNRLLAHILATPMPHLRRLDLSRVRHGREDLLPCKTKIVAETPAYSVPAWPKLRELVLGDCPVGDAFLGRLVEGCPRLECVRIADGVGHAALVSLLQAAGFKRAEGMTEQEGDGDAYVRVGVILQEMSKIWGWKEGEGLVVMV